jgi:hypothetical protein
MASLLRVYLHRQTTMALGSRVRSYYATSCRYHLMVVSLTAVLIRALNEVYRRTTNASLKTLIESYVYVQVSSSCSCYLSAC